MPLLDEFDVYVEARSLQQIQRNGLVTVFLRKLEYRKALLLIVLKKSDKKSPTASRREFVLSRSYFFNAVYPFLLLCSRIHLRNRRQKEERLYLHRDKKFFPFRSPTKLYHPNAPHSRLLPNDQDPMPFFS